MPWQGRLVIGVLATLVCIRFFTEVVDALPRATTFLDVPCFLLLVAAAAARPLDLPRHKAYPSFLGPAMIFVAISTISALVNVSRMELAPPLLFFYTFLSPLGIFYATYRLWPVGRAKALSQLLVVLLLVQIAVVAVINLPAFFSSKDPDSISGTFGDNQYQLVFYLLVLSGVLAAMMRFERRRLSARVAPLLFIAIAVIIFLAQFRALLATTIVSVALIGVFLGVARGRGLAIGVFVLVAFVGSLWYVSDRYPSTKFASTIHTFTTDPLYFVRERVAAGSGVWQLYSDKPLTIVTGSGPATFSSRAWRTFGDLRLTRTAVAAPYAGALTGGEYHTDVADKYVIPRAQESVVIQGSNAVTWPWSSYFSPRGSGRPWVHRSHRHVRRRNDPCWQACRRSDEERIRFRPSTRALVGRPGRILCAAPTCRSGELARDHANHLSVVDFAGCWNEGTRGQARKSRMTRTRLLVVGPVPPPVHGVHVSTELALRNPYLQARFDVEHVDTSDHRPISTVECWDVTNIRLGLAHVSKLVGRMRRPAGVVYLPLSESLGGFLRDSLFIRAAHISGWRVAAHVRNSTLPDFYGQQSAIGRWWVRSTLRKIDSLALLGESLRPLLRGFVPDERLELFRTAPRMWCTCNPEKSDAGPVLSNLLRRKGVVEAVEASILIVREEENAHVLFVGEWEDAELERQLLERVAGLDGRIQFLPPVYGTQKEQLFASTAVVLFPPAWGEGHPRIVLETICRGIPLVTTNRATIGETVTDGESAFVLPDPVPAELADRVLRLLRDEGLRERMGRAARATYLARFTQEHADRRLGEWLTRVANA